MLGYLVVPVDHGFVVNRLNHFLGLLEIPGNNYSHGLHESVNLKVEFSRIRKWGSREAVLFLGLAYSK
jgi:hypothetical protein